MVGYGRPRSFADKIPCVKASIKMDRYNILSFISARGKMWYSLKEGNIDWEVFIEFLKYLIMNRDHLLILLVDHGINRIYSVGVNRSFSRSTEN
jgi:hypothetical protein